MSSLIGRLLLGVFGLFLFQVPQSFAEAHPTTQLITVVYWGSADCRWCTYWEGALSGMEAEFRASEIFKSIKYIEVKNAHLSSPYIETDFQKDGQWIWNSIAEGTVRTPRVRPAWSVFVGQKFVSSYFGTKAWKDTAFPNIAKLVRASIESAEMQAEAIQALASVPIAGRIPVGEVDLVPYLDDKGKDAYRVWLKRSPPRAFAVGIDGAWGRGKSVSDALAFCERYSSEKCEIYAVDLEVVWSGSAK